MTAQIIQFPVKPSPSLDIDAAILFLQQAKNIAKNNEKAAAMFIYEQGTLIPDSAISTLFDTASDISWKLISA